MKLRIFFIKLIDLYQRFLSPMLGPACVFYPSCSVYTKEAIMKYGIWKGTYLGFRRILRCHPWQRNQIDKVP